MYNNCVKTLQSIVGFCDLVNLSLILRHNGHHRSTNPRRRHGNTMATGNRIAHIRWIIQVVEILCAKSPTQNCLSYVLQERVGIINL